jgi:hypothetical protein
MSNGSCSWDDVDMRSTRLVPGLASLMRLVLVTVAVAECGPTPPLPSDDPIPCGTCIRGEDVSRLPGSTGTRA